MGQRFKTTAWNLESPTVAAHQSNPTKANLDEWEKQNGPPLWTPFCVSFISHTLSFLLLPQGCWILWWSLFLKESYSTWTWFLSASATREFWKSLCTPVSCSASRSPKSPPRCARPSSTHSSLLFIRHTVYELNICSKKYFLNKCLVKQNVIWTIKQAKSIQQ